MNDETNNSDRQLQKAILDALAPVPLTDSRIERLFDTEPVVVSDDLLRRIADSARSMVEESKEGSLQWSDSRTPDRRLNNREITMQSVTDTRVGGVRKDNRRGAVAALTVSILSLLAVLLVTSEGSSRHRVMVARREAEKQQQISAIRSNWTLAKSVRAPEVQRVRVGDVIETAQRERRRVSLPDGSVLYVNESALVKVASARRVEVERGEVFVEVVPAFDEERQKERFEIVTPTRTVTALGTKFGVDTSGDATEVVVTQGKVKVSGVEDAVEAGQWLKAKRTMEAGKPNAVNSGLPARLSALPAMRASEHLAWTRDLINTAADALVPASRHAGGAVVSIDPNGQEMKLSLRKYHVDVHIEDGFARTTIDQTYFNHTQSRLEGTFHFPLPPDASLSRLAMYVSGKLMEGGMAEREHARNTFEKIVHKMKDPALLEWVDGSTFKMRVFPLEARQEKRIVLSYTQRLNTAYGKTFYRFPAGHSMDVVRAWSTSIRVNDGSREAWHSPSHELRASTVEKDLLLTAEEANSTMDRDLVVELGGGLRNANSGKQKTLVDTSGAPRQARQNTAKWSRVIHDGHQYLMLRYRPELPGRMKREARNWVFLFEASADRDPLLARTQIEIVRALLGNAEHSDTFNVVTANTEALAFSSKPVPCSAKNIAKALEYLEQTHLIGALDLEKTLLAADELLSAETSGRVNMIVHTGSAIPVLGRQDQSELLRLLPKNASYVGVGVGKAWSRSFMKEAAGRSGGYFTQINPDEEVRWRAFELASLLNSPRLLDVSVGRSRSRSPLAGLRRSSPSEGTRGGEEFLVFADTIVQGEEVCAVTKLRVEDGLPKSVDVTGRLNGRPWKRTVRVRNIAEKADYLPRSWARLEIDRLIADSAMEHKNEIIRLSKSMYVMSPFTSLLVLENEEMYTQYNIDRGRKDHWALYPCPNEIKVVHEPLQTPGVEEKFTKQAQGWFETVRCLPPVQLIDLPTERDDFFYGTVDGEHDGNIGTVRRLIRRPRWSGFAVENNPVREYYKWTLGEAQSDVKNGFDDQSASDSVLGFDGLARFLPDTIRGEERDFRVLFDSSGVEFESRTEFEHRSILRRSRDAGLLRLQEDRPDVRPLIGLPHEIPAVPSDKAAYFVLPDEGRLPGLQRFGQGLPLDGYMVDLADVDDAMPALRESLILSDDLTVAPSVFRWEGPGLNGDASSFGSRTEDRNGLVGLPYMYGVPGQTGVSDLSLGMENIWSFSPVVTWGRSAGQDHQMMREFPDRFPDFSDRAGDAGAAAGVPQEVQLSLTAPPLGNFEDLARNVDALTSQRRFAEAEVLAAQAQEMNPALVEATVLREKVRLRKQIDAVEKLKAQKAAGSLYVLNSVDESLSMTTEDFVTPNVTFWSDLSRQYRFRHRLNANERLLHGSLGDRVSLHFHDVPLVDIIRHIATDHGINVVIDFEAIAVDGGTADRLVSIDVDDITLRSAINLLLEQAGGWVWSIDGEVLKITTQAAQNINRGQWFRPVADRSGFPDLISFAPGLNTSRSDFLALADDEVLRMSRDGGAIENSAKGRVDDAARKLIERARETGWERITYPASDTNRAFTVLCDGAGRHVYSRIISEGLREEVVCDGLTLTQTYRDIGLAAERRFSRFHRGTIEALVPWLLPSIEQLSRGADIICVSKNAIAIVPNSNEESGTRKAEQGGLREVHLVFADDGRLVERRVVLSESQNVVWRVVYEKEGRVRLLDADQNERAVVDLKRERIDPPALTQDRSEIVILPMPVRSSEFLRKGRANATAEQNYDDCTEKELLAFVLAHMSEGNGREVAQIIHKQFFEKKDRRDGFYVLLSRFPNSLAWEEKAEGTDGKVRQVDLRPSPEGSELRQFVRQYISSMQTGTADSAEFDIEGDEDSFIQRLATARNIYVRWNSGRAVSDRTKSQVRKELTAALDFVASCRTDAVGWTLLSVILPKIETADFNEMLAKAVEPFEDNPQLAWLARQERVRSLFKAGRHAKAGRLYGQLLRSSAHRGVLPRIASDIRESFVSHEGTGSWSKLVSDCGRILVDRKLFRTAFAFSVQLRHLQDPEAAGQLLDDILTQVTAEDRPDVMLMVVEQLRRLADGRAEQLMDSILDQKRLRNDSRLWRYAARIAEDLGHRQTALLRLEQAVYLEFVNRPDIINVEQLRVTYTGLMARFEEVIDASATLETEVPHDLYARVIRAADQWRSLEDDPTACCHATARLLAKLNRKNASWGYLTTPLAGRSGESAPWRSLAELLSSQQQVDLADMAWTKAFEFEQTNPEILLAHAKMLKANGRTAASDRLLRNITDSAWQPRFRRVQQEARNLLPR